MRNTGNTQDIVFIFVVFIDCFSFSTFSTWDYLALTSALAHLHGQLLKWWIVFRVSVLPWCMPTGSLQVFYSLPIKQMVPDSKLLAKCVIYQFKNFRVSSDCEALDILRMSFQDQIYFWQFWVASGELSWYLQQVKADFCSKTYKHALNML